MVRLGGGTCADVEARQKAMYFATGCVLAISTSSGLFDAAGDPVTLHSAPTANRHDGTAHSHEFQVTTPARRRRRAARYRETFPPRMSGAGVGAVDQVI